MCLGKTLLLTLPYIIQTLCFSVGIESRGGVTDAIIAHHVESQRGPCGCESGCGFRDADVGQVMRENRVRGRPARRVQKC